MINVLSGARYRQNLIKYGIYQAANYYKPNLVPKNSQNLKFFSSANVTSQKKTEVGATGIRRLPTLIYIQNPITWFINKIDFKMLKSAWDGEFDESEFKRGTKQAVAVICTQISKTAWENLQGLLTRQALIRLQRDVEIGWTNEQRRNIFMNASDIKLVIPRKVHFLRIADQKFVDVDMMFVALKIKDDTIPDDWVLVEMVARFHRNYTMGQLPNWTVTLFKVTRFETHPIRK